MKYLLVAILNGLYGVMTLQMLTRETPGYFLIFAIAIVLSGLGLVGVVLYVISLLKDDKSISNIINSWFQFTKNIDVVLIIGLLFRAFVLQPYIVDGNSMEESYHNNEYILVDQVTYRFRTPERGEVIVFHPPTNPDTNYIKRIIGLPGDTISIENNIVSVNNNVLKENYIFPGSITKTTDSTYSKTLEPGQFFVLGDNREHSSDSREWGPVPRENILGRAWMVVYPTSNFGIIKNPNLNYVTIPHRTTFLYPYLTNAL